MDAETERYFDEGWIGDWVQVEYWVGMQVATVEGEFGGYGRTKRGLWFIHLRGLILIPTIDIRSIVLLHPAGCL